MIMVKLTEKPGDNCQDEVRYMQHLREYKECFLQGNVINVLIQHLADCLQHESRNEKHEQMIELIIVLFLQLLQIPDEKHAGQDHKISLQKRLLLIFSEEAVLDSFIFMS